MSLQDDMPVEQFHEYVAQHPHHPPSTQSALLAGAMAGALAKTVTAPFDRVAILYQVNESRPFTMTNASKTGVTIMKNTGLWGLLRGNNTALIRVIPASAISFTAFGRYRDVIQRKFGIDNSFAHVFIAGALAGLTSQTVTYPFELVRVRMAASWSQSPRYHSYIHGMQEITLREGGVRALFGGLTPTLLGVVPQIAINFLCYESLKKFAVQHWELSHQHDLSTPLRLAFGCFAGVVSTMSTYPLHLISRRMQVQQSGLSKTPVVTPHYIYSSLAASDSLHNSKSPPPLPSALSLPPTSSPLYRSSWGHFNSIYANEGIRGLYKGLSIALIRTPVFSALAFATNDFVLKKTAAYEAKSKGEVDQKRQDQVALLSRQPSPIVTQPASTLHALLAGGLAGAIAKSVIAPADRVKILFQVHIDRQFSLVAAWQQAKSIYQTEGIVGLWRGNSATLLRVIPYSAISYVSFDHYERFFLASNLFPSEKTGFTRFLAGSLAGGTATLLTYPLDLMRARMASHRSYFPRYNTYFSAVQSIIKHEGGRALFHGLSPTLVGIVPYAGMSFACFESCKAYVVKARGYSSQSEIPVYQRLAMGGMAGILAQSATYPLDVIRRRMQVMGQDFNHSIWSGMCHIYKTEGLHQGLFKGLTMNWIKGPVSVAISFTINDYIKSSFVKRRQGI